MSHDITRGDLWQVKLTSYEERLGGSMQPSIVEARLKRDIENMQLEKEALLKDVEVSANQRTNCVQRLCVCWVYKKSKTEMTGSVQENISKHTRG